MISNSMFKYVLLSEIDPLLEALFRYIDQLSFLETPYVIGQHPRPKIEDQWARTTTVVQVSELSVTCTIMNIYAQFWFFTPILQHHQ